jgi:16S rRNA (guanine527-N7)-methyltransferase
MITSEEGAREWLLGLPSCDSKAFARLEALVAALAEENQRQNLVSKSSMDAVWQRHIADSAQLLRLSEVALSPWLDLGTGAGFPGLVIAALRPDWQVTLVESRPLRTEWLMRMRDELELDGV